MIKKIFFLCLILVGLITAQDLVPISTVKTNDANGAPVGVNQVFKVSGIVTSSSQLGTAGPATIQDPTGGVAVYGNTIASQVSIGDSVTVISTLTNYNGLAELDMSKTGSSFTKHKSGCLFDTLIVTIDQIKNQQWNGIEEFESSLIRINNVKINGSGTFDIGSSSGKNYTITDATGQLESGLRIDKDVTSIVGTSIPTDEIDIIGILSQYDNSSPYSSGYQLLPRFRSDLIDDGRPIILTPVLAVGVDSATTNIFFNTSRKGNSQVKYGLTTSLEIDSIIIDEDTTFHKITLNELEPSTKYYFEVYSDNEIGRSEGTLQSFYTLSANPEKGQINVYFNFSVDTSVALEGNYANGSSNFIYKLLNRINSASYSIDLALYSFFGMNDIANAIIAAKNRGVNVRIVYDNRTMQSSMQMLLNAGIKMSQRPAMDGIMHNKFFIFDARDNNTDNDWVWTGSWNVTSSELEWKNNVVEINDAQLADAYTTEFDEMWGSNNDTPNSANAKFGPYKTNNTPHSFVIAGKQVYLYFSPSDQTETQISNAISSADSSIYFGNLTFTSNNIFNAIKNRYNAGAKDIRGIIDNVNDNGSEYTYLQPISEVFDYNLSATFHHKYGIIDAAYSGSDPIVITGSHNWSRAANEDNDENTLIIHDFKIANQYMQEFKKRYNELGGSTVFPEPVVTNVNDRNEMLVPDQVCLNQNFPNPFNPVTTIRFYLPAAQVVELSVYDILGNKVFSLYKGYAQKGNNTINFDVSNVPGGLASGIYFFTLNNGAKLYNRKFVVLK
ncbi:MAG: T9SS C-terminal target domain-containing protein [Ignavibacteriales bacterium]|nr:MAG: T9SS C-terminal target domain-containing protein [Ignavibacteriales bacterium]